MFTVAPPIASHNLFKCKFIEQTENNSLLLASQLNLKILTRIKIVNTQIFIRLNAAGASVTLVTYL